MRIAVDAMGGDNAPKAVVDGAVQASREFGIHVILVGDRDVLRGHLADHDASALPVTIRHASEVVGMHESPSVAVRRKPDSSIKVSFDLVKQGEAQAAVSAGNSGAAMAVAMVVLRRLPGVDRPAIAAVLPSLSGFSVLIDSGANVECRPIHLIQFAIMGSVFCRKVLQIDAPRVGLLSNGEEEVKGTDLTRSVHAALKHSDLNYKGYVEGRDVFTGAADVIVCDGFTGNTVLKASEGVVQAMTQMLKDELSASLRAKVGFFLAKGALLNIKKRMDYAEVGGAPLLGVNGVGIVAHGSSDARAIKNAIRMARNFAERKVNQRMIQLLEQSKGLEAWTSRKEKHFWTQIKEKIMHPIRSDDEAED